MESTINSKIFLWPALIVIGFSVLIIYSNIYNSPFVFDDNDQVVDNRKIRDLSNFFSLEQLLNPRAIVNFTFALNYRFSRLNVFGYHVINVLVHILNGFIVYFLTITTFKKLSSCPKFHDQPQQRRIFGSSIPIIAFFAALESSSGLLINQTQTCVSSTIILTTPSHLTLQVRLGFHT